MTIETKIPTTIRPPKMYIKVLPERVMVIIDLDFDYTIDGGVVSFVPNILDAVSYDWDFGDESTHSEDVTPIHDYGA